jgi:septum formation protein
MSAIWLASASPRRRELLTDAGVRIEVRPTHADESRDPAHDPVAHALSVANRKLVDLPLGRLALAADTVVHLDGAHLEKPSDPEEARAHLRALSGRWHTVTTAIVVAYGGDRAERAVHTEVRFRELTEAEIQRYVATGEPLDKAGAYGIQGRGGGLVAELRGSYTNVVGLPLEETLELLATLSPEALEEARVDR